MLGNSPWKKNCTQLKKNQSLDLVSPPTEYCKPIGLKWIFKVKRDAKREVIQHKARLIAKGFSQR